MGDLDVVKGQSNELNETKRVGDQVNVPCCGIKGKGIGEIVDNLECWIGSVQEVAGLMIPSWIKRSQNWPRL